MENFGPRRSSRSEHVPQWFTPKSEEAKKIFEQGREDVKSVLLTSKEGMKVGSVMGFLESHGLSIKFRELGFNHFNEFLFHCSDFIDVRVYPTNNNNGYPNHKYLFLRPSAVDQNSEHLLKLVQTQHADKKRKDGRPRPTLKNLVFARPETLLDHVPKFSYFESSENKSGPMNGAGQSYSRGGRIPSGHWRGGGASRGGNGRGSSVPVSRPVSSSSAPRLQVNNTAAATTSRNVAVPIRSLLSVGAGGGGTSRSGFDCTDRVSRDTDGGGNRIQHNPPTPVVIPTMSGNVRRYIDPQNAPRPAPPASEIVSRSFCKTNTIPSSLQTGSRSFCYAGGLGPAEPTSAPTNQTVAMEQLMTNLSIGSAIDQVCSSERPAEPTSALTNQTVAMEQLMTNLSIGSAIDQVCSSERPAETTSALTNQTVAMEQLMTNLSIGSAIDQEIRPIPPAIGRVLDHLDLDPTIHYDPRKAILPDVKEDNAEGTLMSLTVAKYVENELVQVKTLDRSSRQSLKKLEAMMSAWYSRNFSEEDRVPAAHLVNHGVYAGFDNERMVWSRVQIDLNTVVDEHNDNLIRASLIDHGYTKIMEKSELGYLKPAHVHLKRQSFLIIPTRIEAENQMSQRLFMYHSTGKHYKFFIHPQQVPNEEKYKGIPVFRARFIYELMEPETES